MVSWLEAVENVTNAAACRLFTAANDTSDYWRGIRLMRGGFSIPVGDIGARAAAGIQSRVCPQNIPIGGFPPVGTGEVPGDGVFGDGTGQCMDTYSVVCRAQCRYVPGPVSSTPEYEYVATYVSNMTGPLTDINFRVPGLLVGGIGNNQAPPLEFRRNMGSFFAMTTIGVDNTDNKGQGSNQVIGGVEFVSATPVGGFEDNCGNEGTPGSSGPPTDGPMENTDIIYEDGDGNEVVDPADTLVCPPVMAPNGDILVPVRITTESYDLKVYINASTGDTVIRGPGVEDEGPCTPPEMPDSEEPPNDEPDPPDPEEPTIIGVLVITNTTPDNINVTQVGDLDGPDSFFPDVGTVTFAKEVGGVAAWSGPIRVQQRRQYVPCPFPDGAYAIEGLERPGVSWTLVPQRAILEP